MSACAGCFEVNVLGALLTAREAARRMAESAGGLGGSIVLVSSTASRLGAPNTYVDYAASKGAVDTLTIGLAKELGPEGVRVNAIRPGLIETEIHLATGEPDRALTLGRSTPLGRPGRRRSRRGRPVADERRRVLRHRGDPRRRRGTLTSQRRPARSLRLRPASGAEAAEGKRRSDHGARLLPPAP